MASTGRQPYQSWDTVPYGTGTRRLRPPASLSEPQKRAFIDLVVACPSTQFEPQDIPLLVRWCELCVMAEAASVELQASGMLAPDGKPSPWFTIHQQATKSLSGLALRLRIGPQSRAHKAPKKLTASSSYFDIEMELGRDASEDEGKPDA
jgi:phage terminase small subunit